MPMKVKNKLPFIFAIIFMIISITSTHSFAQVGGTNGGDPNELSVFKGRDGKVLPSWYTVKYDIYTGLMLNKHLQIDLKGWNPDVFKAKALASLVTPVEFKDEWIIVNNVDRPCKNFEDLQKNHHIQCNPLQYVASMKNLTAEEQYKLVAHEYFSSAGLEPNSYGISDYPFSSQISATLHSVTFNLWALASNLETAQSCALTSQLSPVGTQCKTSRGFIFTRTEINFQTAWTDEQGKTWFDETKTGLDEYAAAIFCNQVGQQTLPLKSDFELAEAHGLREVFKNYSNRYFWTASVNPGHNEDNIIFYNNSGVFGAIVRGEVTHNAVRCINR